MAAFTEMSLAQNLLQACMRIAGRRSPLPRGLTYIGSVLQDTAAYVGLEKSVRAFLRTQHITPQSAGLGALDIAV